MKIKIAAAIAFFIAFMPFIYPLDKTPYYVNTETYNSYKDLLRGVHYFDQERYDAAIASFKNSLNSNPTDKFIRYWYSKALYKAGYMPLAINEWQNLVRMGYGDPIILSKINKYASAPMPEAREDILSNFIYLKTFSTNVDFSKNINQPIEIKVNKNGIMYVLDYSDSSLKEFDVNGNMIKKISKGKRVETPQTAWWQRLIQFIFRIYPYEKIERPRGFTLDEDGNIYIANTGKDVVFKFNSNGDYLLSIGKSGVGDGELLGPSALALDVYGRLYITDTGNNRISVFDTNGNFLTNFGSMGENDGEFFDPSGIAVNSDSIFVADTGNNRVERFDLYGNYIETITHEMLQSPRGLSFSPDGNLFIADGSKVFYYNIGTGIFTLFQNSERYTVTPTSVCEGPNGEIYLSDFLSGRVDVYARKEQYYANLDVFIDRAYLSSFPSIVTSVTVRDRLRRPVVGLTPENFFIIENGSVNQKLGFYDAPELHEYRFIYLIESSEAAKEYENMLKDEISNFTAALTNNDEVLVIHYNDSVYQNGGYSESNLRIMENAYNFNFAGGISALDNALYEAIRLSGESFKKTAIIHFSVSNPDYREFDNMRFAEVAAFAKNNSISINQVYIGQNKNNYFLDNISKDTYGLIIDASNSINYKDRLDTMKNIDFGRYFLYYRSEKALSQIGQYRGVTVRVEYRDMYGEEESGYIIP